jgi:oxepin-CoA hydrolase/3-oxo-5,6-dehydrosuberyl-CoA semialdehyde dehydrogenase
MKKLASYVNGSWIEGKGTPRPLYNPATEEVVAETSTEGIDFGSALEHARSRGGPALRALTFAQRGEVLRAMSKAMYGAREELLDLAMENGGNTRGDAKFDVDGACATLAAYAELGQSLGDTRVITEGDEVQIGRTARYQGVHVLTPRHGVAVHINAFNFPAWGLAEKAATALLAGMPVVSKPATATAVVAHRMMQIFADIVPEGALSFIAGDAGDLLSHLEGQDVLAFTGSSQTARTLRGLDCVLERSVHINVEADSLNAAVLGPDVELGTETAELFLADVIRDMIQKAGQKCTAIRRVFVPESRLEAVSQALCERLGGVVVGNPADKSVRMGPLATAAQLRDVRAGIELLGRESEALFGGEGQIEPVGVAAGKGYFVGPVLRLCARPAEATAVHEHEVFGPVATVVPYSGQAEDAAAEVRKGAGGLVASVYSDDREYLSGIVPAIAAWHGRLYLGSAKMAAQSMGPGTVLPQLVHGGPGRAGGGEELGGVRGMALYQQRTAVQGDKGILKALFG